MTSYRKKPLAALLMLSLGSLPSELAAMPTGSYYVGPISSQATTVTLSSTSMTLDGGNCVIQFQSQQASKVKLSLGDTCEQKLDDNPFAEANPINDLMENVSKVTDYEIKSDGNVVFKADGGKELITLRPSNQKMESTTSPNVSNSTPNVDGKPKSFQSSKGGPTTKVQQKDDKITVQITLPSKGRVQYPMSPSKSANKTQGKSKSKTVPMEEPKTQNIQAIDARIADLEKKLKDIDQQETKLNTSSPQQKGGKKADSQSKTSAQKGSTSVSSSNVMNPNLSPNNASKSYAGSVLPPPPVLVSYKSPTSSPYVPATFKPQQLTTSKPGIQTGQQDDEFDLPWQPLDDPVPSNSSALLNLKPLENKSFSPMLSPMKQETTKMNSPNQWSPNSSGHSQGSLIFDPKLWQSNLSIVAKDGYSSKNSMGSSGSKPDSKNNNSLSFEASQKKMDAYKKDESGNPWAPTSNDQPKKTNKTDYSDSQSSSQFQYQSKFKQKISHEKARFSRKNSSQKNSSMPSDSPQSQDTSSLVSLLAAGGAISTPGLPQANVPSVPTGSQNTPKIQALLATLLQQKGKNANIQGGVNNNVPNMGMSQNMGIPLQRTSLVNTNNNAQIIAAPQHQLIHVDGSRLPEGSYKSQLQIDTSIRVPIKVTSSHLKFQVCKRTYNMRYTLLFNNKIKLWTFFEKTKKCGNDFNGLEFWNALKSVKHFELMKDKADNKLYIIFKTEDNEKVMSLAAQ